MTFQEAMYMHDSNPGESSRSPFSSRSPYLDHGNTYGSHGADSLKSHDDSMTPWNPDGRYYAPASHAAYHTTGETSYPDSNSFSSGRLGSPEQPPPLPMRPHDDQPSEWSRASPDNFEHRPDLPPRPQTGTQDSHHTDNDPEQLVLLPPRRRLTTGDIPVNTVGYTRDPERVIAYLIPLPPPSSSNGQTLDVPQRYMIYTPPAPHLLKPTTGTATTTTTGTTNTKAKEGKRHKAKRLAQQEVRKAKTYDGKTLSLRGLHYKAVRGIDRAVAAIKTPDITFLNRVPRKQVTELVLIHPASVLAGDGGTTPREVHAEFRAQLARTRRRAARDGIVSTLLLPPALAVDTLAAVVWPFGGLAEIDGVWMYASISGYLTARSVTRRMEREPVVDGDVDHRGGEEDTAAQEVLGWRNSSRSDRGFSPVSEEDIYTAGIETSGSGSGAGGATRLRARDTRRDSRQLHFEEMLDEEEEEDLKRDAARDGGGNKKDKKRTLKVRLVPDDAMDTMALYFQEICHQRNPKAFGSPGVPPTKTDVLASIGWWPDRRGRAPGVEHPGDWEDENVSVLPSVP
jgi:hypothetical protein